MPPVDAGYLLGYLFEIGPTMAGGMGAGPVTNQEILAWQALTGITLDAWEARTLRSLSCEYLAESHRAEKRGAKAPWSAPDAKPEVSDTQAALRALSKL